MFILLLRASDKSISFVASCVVAAAIPANISPSDIIISLQLMIIFVANWAGPFFNYSQ